MLYICTIKKIKDMKSRFLLPSSFRKPGLVLMCLAFAVWLAYQLFNLPPVFEKMRIFAIYNSGGFFDNHREYFKIITHDMGYTLFNLVFIAGTLMFGFSRLKTEDEYITKVRLESLVWAVYANFIVIFIANVAIYGE